MTTITACEYSPAKGQPLTPLDKTRVGLLNKNGHHDITDRIRTVVQKHLNYQGTEVFKTTFTKQQIVFTLKNGPANETRVLNYVNNQWVLTQNNADSPLAPALGREVDFLISEILSNIRDAHNYGAPTSAPAPIGKSPISSITPEFTEIRDRLTSLEKTIRNSNSFQARQKIEEADSEGYSSESTEDNDDLQERIKELQNSLAEITRRNEDLEAEHEALQKWLDQDDESDNAVVELVEARREVANLQKENLKKDQVTHNLQQQITDAQSELSNLNELREALAEASSQITALKKGKESLEQKLTDSSSDVEASAQDIAELQQQIKAATQLEEAYQKQSQELEASIGALEGQNQQLKRELENSKKTIATTLALGEVALQRMRSEQAKDKDSIVQGLKEETARLRRAFENAKKTHQQQIERQAAKIERIKKIYQQLSVKFPSLAVAFGSILAEFEDEKTIVSSTKFDEF